MAVLSATRYDRTDLMLYARIFSPVVGSVGDLDISKTTDRSQTMWDVVPVIKRVIRLAAEEQIR